MQTTRVVSPDNVEINCEDDPDCAPSPAKKQGQINLKSHDVSSNNQDFHFETPSSHRLVTANYLSCLQSQDERVKSLKETVSKKKFVTGADPLTRSLLSTALAATPALATKAAAHTIPLIAASFLNEHDLLPDIKSPPTLKLFHPKHISVI